METLALAQYGIYWVLSLVMLGLQAFSLVDAVRRRPDAFPASGNQTKTLWLALLGAATAVGLVSLPNFLSPLNILNLVAVVVAGVYLVKVRPALIAITGSGRGDGPYGRW